MNTVYREKAQLMMDFEQLVRIDLVDFEKQVDFCMALQFAKY